MPCSEVSSLRFIHLRSHHLIRHRVDVHQTTVQTNRGSRGGQAESTFTHIV